MVAETHGQTLPRLTRFSLLFGLPPDAPTVTDESVSEQLLYPERCEACMVKHS